jgi:Ni/Co efflux regulator RcnB
MEYRFISRPGLAVLLIAGALFGTSVMAAPPTSFDTRRGPAHSVPRTPHRADPAPPSRARPASPPQRFTRHPPPPRFDDRSRGVPRDYHRRSHVDGRCPPGLSRRGASCVPNGARPWVRGRPLPWQVIHYDLPAHLLVRLPVAPAGYRYARVGNDILMLAPGTNIVVDVMVDVFD